MEGSGRLADRRAVPGVVLAVLGSLGVAVGLAAYSPHADGPGATFVIVMLAFAVLSGVVAIGGLTAAARHRVALPLAVETIVLATATTAAVLRVLIDALPSFPVFWPGVVLVVTANAGAVVVTRRRVVPWFEHADAS